MKTFFIYTIGLYRRYISPLLPPACRFTPTCSEYAVEAFSRKSTLTAIRMTLVRIAKCHPFHPGGYDPVDPVGKPGSEAGVDRELTLPSSGCKTHTRPHEATD
jgi:putative membrane protein insertion efficiency factor